MDLQNFNAPYNNLQTGQSNPGQLLGLISTLNNLKDFQARQAVGQAYQQATDPESGLVDTGKFMGLVKGNPDAALRAPEAAANSAALTGQYISNATNQFGLNSGQTSFLANLAGSYINKKGGATDADVATARAIAARNGIPINLIDGILGQGQNDNRTPQQRFQDLNDYALGPGGRSGIVSGPPNAATGQPQNITQGQATRTATSPQGPYGAQGFPAALPPGEGDILAQSATRASQLQATAGTTAQYHADLDNLKQDSKVLDNLGGPTFEVEKKLNQLSQRISGFGITMTPDQLKAGESFDKIANQISRQQGQLFGDTDATRNMSVGSNPSTSQSAYGREGIIDMLQGNQDAVDRARNIWIDARAKGAPANSYDTFMNELSKSLDPRVFQFNRLSRDNQQKFLNQMDPDELPDFEQKYKTAIGLGWVKALKKAKANASATQ